MSGRGVSLDWEQRFRAERTPWERPTLHPAYNHWRSSGQLLPGRILVPGAGRSSEPLALARDGFDVTVVDLSPSAAAVQRSRFETSRLPGTVVIANLLAWTPQDTFDAVYDQTCLCALPPEVWPEYAVRLHAWLRPGAQLFILFMQSGADSGPPYHCDLSEMRQMFNVGWHWPNLLDAAFPSGPGRNEQPVVLQRL